MADSRSGGPLRANAPLRVAVKVVVIAGWFSIGASSAAVGASLLGSIEFRAGPLPALSEWRQVFERIDRESLIYSACARARTACPSKATVAWEDLIARLAKRPTIQQLEPVNRFINGWQYITDRKNYGRDRRWATPLEFFERSGDCEDYAVAKYVTLRRLGARPGQLRIVVARDLRRKASHAVVAVRLGDRIHILDNLKGEVRQESRIWEYKPLYAVNERSYWVYVAPAPLP